MSSSSPSYICGVCSLYLSYLEFNPTLFANEICRDCLNNNIKKYREEKIAKAVDHAFEKRDW